MSNSSCFACGARISKHMSWCSSCREHITVRDVLRADAKAILDLDRPVTPRLDEALRVAADLIESSSEVQPSPIAQLLRELAGNEEDAS